MYEYVCRWSVGICLAMAGNTELSPVHAWIRRTKAQPVLGKFSLMRFKCEPSEKVQAMIASCQPLSSHCGGAKNLCENCFPDEQSWEIRDSPSGNILDVTRFPISSVLSRYQLKDCVSIPWFTDFRYTMKRKSNQNYPEFWKEVIESPRVKTGIERAIAQAESISPEDTATPRPKDKKYFRNLAKRYLDYMRARISVFIIRATGYLLFKVSRRLFDGILVSKQQMNQLKEVTLFQRNLPIVYLPQHRSHLDYMLITFVLWHWDIRIPHVASGDNLNLSGFGWLLKSLGGFFIRRKLDESAERKDYVYRSVLQSYMTELLKSGEQIEFFPEGGRSRSGKPLLPKSGLLSIVVDAFIDGTIPDAYLVPVSYTYEKLLEGGFSTELLGLPKQRESFWAVVKSIWQALGRHYGYVRLDFGRPVSIKDFLRVLRSKTMYSFADFPQKDDSFASEQAKMTMEPSMFFQSPSSAPDNRFLIRAICEHMMFEANANASLTCPQLLAALLLGKYRNGGSLEELSMDLTWLGLEALLRHRDVIGFDPRDQRKSVSQAVLHAADLLGNSGGGNLVEILHWIHTVEESEEGETDSGIGADGDRGITIVPSSRLSDRMLLSYYKNGVLTAFVLDSIVAMAVNSMPNDSFAEEDLVTTCMDLSDLLKFEFLLFRPCDSPRNKLKEVIKEHFMVETSAVLVRHTRRHRVEVVGGEEVLREVELEDEEETWDTDNPPPSNVLPESEREMVETLAYDLDETQREQEHISVEFPPPDDTDMPTIVETPILTIVERDVMYARNVLEFYKNLLKPIIQSYYWTATKLEYLLSHEGITERMFLAMVQHTALNRFGNQNMEVSNRLPDTFYEEAAHSESIRNALRFFVDRLIVRSRGGESGEIFLDPEYKDVKALREVAEEFRKFL